MQCVAGHALWQSGDGHVYLRAQIFVELERARMTRTLSAIYEADGKINEASEMLQEVAVRVGCARGTRRAVRSHCVAARPVCRLRRVVLWRRRRRQTFCWSSCGCAWRRRISSAPRSCHARSTQRLWRWKASRCVRGPLVFVGATVLTTAPLHVSRQQSLRIKFYNLMIELHTHQAKALDLFRDWEAVYTTRGVADDDEKAATALKHACLFLCLSAYDNEQIDNLHKLSQDKRLNSMPTFQCVAWCQSARPCTPVLTLECVHPQGAAEALYHRRDCVVATAGAE